MIKDDCIIAKGEITRLGYIRLWNKGNRILAHRYEYEKVHGAIQEGFEIDHICRNRACCNVNHLRAVNHTKNMRNTINNKFVELITLPNILSKIAKFAEQENEKIEDRLVVDISKLFEELQK